MDTFVKITAGVLISAVLGMILSNQKKELALLLSLAAVTMGLLASLGFLRPVIAFIKQLQRTAQLDMELFAILLKAVGITLLAELVGLICTDAGNVALGKVLQILASTVILWLSIPLFEQLLKLIENILVAI